jgi:hypothetical protein
VRSIHAISTVAAVAIAAGVTLVAAEKSGVSARWRSGEITIDGVAKEWEGLAVPLTETKASIGVVNDGETLYLCLLASEAQTRGQILRRGLIVWFDPAGGTKKALGIKFPVGTAGADGGRSARHSPADTTTKEPEPIEVVDRLEILGPGKNDRRSLVLEQVPGIHVKIGQAQGVVVYELSIPLQQAEDHPYAVGARPGTLIGIGLSTPEQERSVTPSGGQPRSGFGGIGGRGGMGGGMGGSPSGMGKGEFTPVKPVNTWIKVQLASSPEESRR